VAASASPVAPVAAVVPHGNGTQWFWRAIALASLALWLLAIVAVAAWWLVRRKAQSYVNRGAPVDVADAGGVAANAPKSLRTLQADALEAARSGDPVACEHALLVWARAFHPDIANATALGSALSDPAQRSALDALQRVRWQGGDVASACAAVAGAFARGFVWNEEGKQPRTKPGGLPPLYPSRD
jgi:hypothetical protein